MSSPTLTTASSNFMKTFLVNASCLRAWCSDCGCGCGCGGRYFLNFQWQQAASRWRAERREWAVWRALTASWEVTRQPLRTTSRAVALACRSHASSRLQPSVRTPSWCTLACASPPFACTAALPNTYALTAPYVTFAHALQTSRSTHTLTGSCWAGQAAGCSMARSSLASSISGWCGRRLSASSFHWSRLAATARWQSLAERAAGEPGSTLRVSQQVLMALSSNSELMLTSLLKGRQLTASRQPSSAFPTFAHFSSRSWTLSSDPAALDFPLISMPVPTASTSLKPTCTDATFRNTLTSSSCVGLGGGGFLGLRLRASMRSEQGILERVRWMAVATAMRWRRRWAKSRQRVRSWRASCPSAWRSSRRPMVSVFLTRLASRMTRLFLSLKDSSVNCASSASCPSTTRMLICSMHTSMLYTSRFIAFRKYPPSPLSAYSSSAFRSSLPSSLESSLAGLRSSLGLPSSMRLLWSWAGGMRWTTRSRTSMATRMGLDMSSTRGR